MRVKTNSLRYASGTGARAIWRRLTSGGFARRIGRFLAAASLCLTIMVLTEPSLVIVWDEGYSLGREARVRTWFRALADPAAFARGWEPPYEDLVPPNRFRAPRPDELDTRGELLFNPVVLDWFWPFAREEPDGHPPVYALVGLAGDLVVPSWEPLARARLGPMLVFSLTCGALFVFVDARWGPWPGIAAAGAWLLQPHLFALAHYATYDGLLASLWVGCILSFARAIEPGTDRAGSRPRWRWVLLFGFLQACAMGTKLTGWFLPLPSLAWAVLRRDRRGLAAVVAGTLFGLGILILLVPPWWHDPVLGLVRFFQSNLTRAETMRIKTLFLGTIYETPNGSLPWYNTIVWTLMVTPVGFLILGSIGIIRAVPGSRRDPLGLLFLAHWAFLMVLRAMPHTPGHDGVRQFLPAFGVLALLVGPGADFVVRRLGKWGRALVLLAIAEGGLSVGLMMPVPLSYYSPMVGGLPGATRLGMEPTFYWDALRPEVLDWLNSRTPPGQKVRFTRYPTSWLYLRQTKKLLPGILPTDPGDWAWYVLQNRSGQLRPMDRDLIANGHPAKVYTKCGVPLLWVFPYRDVAAWERSEGPRGESSDVNSPSSAKTGRAPADDRRPTTNESSVRDDSDSIPVLPQPGLLVPALRLLPLLVLRYHRRPRSLGPYPLRPGYPPDRLDHPG